MYVPNLTWLTAFDVVTSVKIDLAVDEVHYYTITCDTDSVKGAVEMIIEDFQGDVFFRANINGIQQEFHCVRSVDRGLDLVFDRLRKLDELINDESGC